MEWLESKDKGKPIELTLKHVIGDLGEVEKIRVANVRFNSHRYQARGCRPVRLEAPKAAQKEVFYS